MLKKWDELPEFMKTPQVRPYYDALAKKQVSLFFKRVFDIVAALVLLVLLSPVLVVISFLVSTDSPGGAFFLQKRVTRYGKVFKIVKFRTMQKNADKMGTQVTVLGDSRITKVGKFLRRTRLDELPQLINILSGDMSFCGTRPESPHYVKEYTPEMFATLLLPAGVTSKTSILFKDEEKLLEGATDVDAAYINEVLPKKMKYNLEGIMEFGFFKEIGIMLKTVAAVLK